MTDTVQSLYGLCCPSCESDDYLAVSIQTLAELTADGTEPFGDHEWDDHSHCRCANCGHAGIVRDFRTTDEEAVS